MLSGANLALQLIRTLHRMALRDMSVNYALFAGALSLLPSLSFAASEHNAVTACVRTLTEGIAHKCLHLLDYADDKQLRQVIQESLNRGEQLQGLKRALAALGGNQFRGKSPDEMAMWNSCADLLANCIVHYNAMIMSFFKSYCLAHGKDGQLKYLRSVSPASWEHLLLSGVYDLAENDDHWDVESEIIGLNLAA